MDELEKTNKQKGGKKKQHINALASKSPSMKAKRMRKDRKGKDTAEKQR